MLPVFTMYYMEDMTNNLKLMGVRDVFDINLANMTLLFNRTENSTSEYAFNRQGWINVSRKGFTISAFSAAGVNKRDAVSGKVMHADRPFLFLVFEKSTTTLMFAGRISNPNGWKMDDHEAKAVYKVNWYLIFLMFFFVVIFGFWCWRALSFRSSLILPEIISYSQCSACCSNCVGSCIDRIRSCWCFNWNNPGYPGTLYRGNYSLIESDDGLNIL